MAKDPTHNRRSEGASGRGSPRSRRRRSERQGLWARLTGYLRRGLRLVLLGIPGLILALFAWVALYAVINPPGGHYMWQESRRLGSVRHEWVDIEGIAPVMARAAVAAEDANFCRHWGFDLPAIRAALDSERNYGASSITQQVVKNVFLWHGRSWLRKALEAVLTPMLELIWGKARILEVYLNVAEFGEGVFGVQAAAQAHFSRGAGELSARQAALLAAILPAPQSRSPTRPTDFINRRARAIEDGAATIARDGRSACFEG